MAFLVVVVVIFFPYPDRLFSRLSFLVCLVELGEMRTNNLQMELRCKNLEKSEKEMARRLQVKESEMKSMERSVKLAQNRYSLQTTQKDIFQELYYQKCII